MTRLFCRCALLFAMALWLHASGALAQQQPDKARARELYTKGQQLFKQGDYEEARRAFEDAYATVPNPIVLLSIAECQVRSEQYNAAVDTLNRYLEERKDAPDRAQVEAQIEKLKQKPAILTVESTPEGALIYIDGQDTGKLTPADIELPGGDYRVTVQITGFQRAEQAVTLPYGGKLTVSLALPEVAKPEPKSEAPPKVATEERRGGSLLPVWVATGVAGAGLVTGALLGGFALKQRNSFNDRPTEGKADKGERLALFADVGFGIAAAAAVTAVVLYVTRDEEAKQSEESVSIAPAVSRHALGLAGQVSF